MDKVAFVMILNNKNEPVFSQLLDSHTTYLDMEMIVYSSLDMFDIHSNKKLKNRKHGKSVRRLHGQPRLGR
jgi:hypothetical protein